MVAPSVVEEAGDYILNVDMFQFVWWNIDHLDNFYFFDFQYLPNDLVIWTIVNHQSSVEKYPPGN